MENMTTFEAIAHIRRKSLSRSDAMRFLIQHLGFSSTYADEIVAVIFAESAERGPGDDGSCAARQ